MLALGGRIANPRWTALGCDDFVDWLTKCHPDYRVFLRVFAHFTDCVDKIEIAGPLAAARSGHKWIEKLSGAQHRGLGKVNYNDSVGAFRFFFKFGTLNGRPVVVFADGDYKTSEDFRPARYLRALRLVEECMAKNGVEEAHLW